MNIQLYTLTPTHIGSGLELQGSFEYLHFQRENKIAVIDAEKVLQVLGEENLPQWVACIDKGEDLLPLLNKRSATLKPEDVAARTITTSTSTQNKPIRSHLFSGNGTALIPGSSIKGAIRTAVWASRFLERPEVAKERRNLGITDRRDRFSWNDQLLNKLFFGNDPNHDIFRLLQVGDASFEQTEVFRTDVVNQYYRKWNVKRELTQYVEAIPSGKSAIAHFNFNSLLHKRADKTFNRSASTLEPAHLFPLINQHTERLVEDEVTYWIEKANNPDALGDYVEHLENILDIISTCSAQECVLRLGWGSGFRFMTGDWHGAMTEDDYDDLVRSLRPKHPDDLIFPKTIRLISGGTPLGFIKLKLVSE